MNLKFYNFRFALFGLFGSRRYFSTQTGEGAIAVQGAAYLSVCLA